MQFAAWFKANAEARVGGRVKTAVIPAAGFGTRMLPATKAFPKELLPVVDRPVIDYVVEEALAAGIEHVVFVVSRGKEAIEVHFDHQVELEAQLEAGGAGKAAFLEAVRRPILNQGRASFVRQGRALGLGHAVWCARHIVGDAPFAVLLPDVICTGAPGATARLVETYAETGGCVITVNAVPEDEVHRYGVIAPGGRSGSAIEVMGLVEKPRREVAPSTLSVTGRYVLTPDIFAELERGERGAGGEIQLTDAMARLIGRRPFHAVEIEAPIYDCGDKIGWLGANLALAKARPDVWPSLEPIVRGLI